MKISRNRLKELVRETLLQESEYQTFFKKALEKSGKSIPDMSDEEKKSFFNKIDAAWNGKGEKKESTEEACMTGKLSNQTSSSKSVTEGRKRFYQQDGIGKAKYTISFHDGKSKHKDGSDFYGIQTFKNKNDLSKFREDLVSKGYKEDSGYKSESVNEDMKFPNMKQWWKETPDDLLAFVYWMKRQIPPKDRDKAYKDIATQLNKQFKAPADIYKGIIGESVNESSTPDTFVSKTKKGYTLIHKGMPLMTSDRTMKDVRDVAKQMKVTIAPKMWNNGKWDPVPTDESVNEAFGNDSAMAILHKIVADKKFMSTATVGEFLGRLNKETKAFSSKIEQDILKGLFKDYKSNKNWKYDDSKYSLEESINEGKFKKGDRVKVTGTQYKGKEGLIISNDMYQGQYQVQQVDGKIRGFKPNDIEPLKESVNEDTISGKKAVRFFIDVYNHPTTFAKATNWELSKIGTGYKKIFDLAKEKIKKDKASGNYKIITGTTPSKLTIESVNENFTPHEIDTIKQIITKQKKLIGLTPYLKKAGFKNVEFVMMDSAPPHIKIKKGNKTFLIVNKKYVDKPDFVVGDIAGGLDEGVIKKSIREENIPSIDTKFRINKNDIKHPKYYNVLNKIDGLAYREDGATNTIVFKTASDLQKAKKALKVK